MSPDAFAQVSIRKAKKTDTSQLIGLQRLSLSQLATQDYSESQLSAIFQHKQNFRLRSWGCRIWVAETLDPSAPNSNIVGFAALGRFGIIGALYTHPQWIRQGIGRTLLKTLEREAVHRRVRVLTVAASLTAVPFYQACGYHITHNPAFVAVRGVQVPCVYMQKEINPQKQSHQQSHPRARAYAFRQESKGVVNVLLTTLGILALLYGFHQSFDWLITTLATQP